MLMTCIQWYPLHPRRILQTKSPISCMTTPTISARSSKQVQWFTPRAPQQQVRPGAFHDDGRNAREVSILEDEVTTVVSPDTTPQLGEVTATVVDTDEENRKRQEEIEKEVQARLEQQMAEQEESVEIAEIVTGFWCSRRVKIVIVLALALVVMLAIVLGTVLPYALEPPEPATAAATAGPTSPLPGLTELLSSVSLDGGAALQTPSSPQNKALNWLAGNAHLDA